MSNLKEMIVKGTKITDKFITEAGLNVEKSFWWSNDNGCFMSETKITQFISNKVEEIHSPKEEYEMMKHFNLSMNLEKK